jgi:para-aminobenzoate synthetase/4-amino-4-deoxychorismate lyase
MQLITALESSPRRVYTGAFGYFAPGRLAQFNVAIRTLLVDKSCQQAEYGVGGGIVWDSSPTEEWDETITKSRILYERPQPFELLETMRWTPEDGWFLLDEHLDRLARSAEYFAYPLDLPALCVKLTCLVDCFQDAPHRVRLRLAANGQVHLEHQTLDLEAKPARIGIAKTPIDSSDRFLYHKTTRRDVYRKALADCPGCKDVLLWNARREVTESCMANLVVELEGQICTPPDESGLLPGAYRAWLLKQGKVKERRISLDELEQCSQIYLANSVRGMWKVEIS